jgi:hypothetical protein
MAVSFKGAHFPQDIILMGVRWYVACPLSTRHVEERMRERRVHVDHSTINRWVIKYSPQLEEAFHRRPPERLGWAMGARAGGGDLRAVARVFEVAPNRGLGWLLAVADHAAACSR